MNKDQFKLQTYHNRYVRSAIAGICKIILWTDIYIFVMWLILSISARIEASTATEVLKSTATKSSSDSDTAAIVTVGLLILFCTVIYNWAVAHEIVDKVNQHKRIIALENEYFGVVPIKSEDTNQADDEGESETSSSDSNGDDELDDDML